MSQTNLDQVYDLARKGQLPDFWTNLLLGANSVFIFFKKILKDSWFYYLGLWLLTALADRFYLHLWDLLKIWPLCTWATIGLLLIWATAYAQTILGEVWAKAYLFIRDKSQKYIHKANVLAFWLLIGEPILVAVILYSLWEGLVLTGGQIVNWSNAGSVAAFIVWVAIWILSALKLDKEDDITKKQLSQQRR